MDEMIAVILTGVTAHPDAPEGTTVFSATNKGEPVVFYMPHDAGDALKSFLKLELKGEGRPLNINVNYYQHANRLAVLRFLLTRGIEADLVDVYFTGVTNSDIRSPVDRISWAPAIAEMKNHLGLRGDSALEHRAHEVFIEI
jgi:hypothetical protein